MGTEFIDQERTTRNAVYDQSVSFVDPVYNGEGEISLKRGLYGTHQATLGLRAGGKAIYTYLTRQQIRHLIIVMTDLLSGDDCGYYYREWPSDDYEHDPEAPEFKARNLAEYMALMFPSEEE